MKEIVYRLYYIPGKRYYSAPRNIMGVYGSEKGAKLGRKHAAVYGAKETDFEIHKFNLEKIESD